LQLYSGNFLSGVKGRGAKPYVAHDGFYLEAQASHNQVSNTDTEAVIPRPGQVYWETTAYHLGVRR